MASIKVSDNCPDGCLIGNAATSKVGFYGATPVVQQTPSSATLTDISTLAAAITAIALTLKNLGLTS